jgi:hypothetical protein
MRTKREKQMKTQREGTETEGEGGKTNTYGGTDVWFVIRWGLVGACPHHNVTNNSCF